MAGTGEEGSRDTERVRCSVHRLVADVAVLGGREEMAHDGWGRDVLEEILAGPG